MELQAQLLANNPSLSASIAHKADQVAVHQATNKKNQVKKKAKKKASVRN
jgi:hypothetical protein